MVQERCAPDGTCERSEELVRASVAVDDVNFRVGAWLPDDWAGWDDDGDGLSNGDEQEIGTDPWNWDSDWDGVGDAQEIADGTDPLNADTDGDGCRDGDEAALGLDPQDPDDGGECAAAGAGTDSDYDGLSDELEAAAGTNPYNWDTDEDGCNDFVEYQDQAAGGSADPLDPAVGLPECYAGGMDMDMDMDGDGVLDADDNCPMVPNPDQVDTDGNGVGDVCEMGDGEPVDTDGDGISDGLEMMIGADPADPADPVTYALPSRDHMVGTWDAVDPESGAVMATVVFDINDPVSYRVDFFLPPPAPAEFEEGTWTEVDLDGDGVLDGIETTITGATDPAEVGATEFVPVVFLDSGYTQMVVNGEVVFGKR